MKIQRFLFSCFLSQMKWYIELNMVLGVGMRAFKMGNCHCHTILGVRVWNDQIKVATFVHFLSENIVKGAERTQRREGWYSVRLSMYGGMAWWFVEACNNETGKSGFTVSHFPYVTDIQCHHPPLPSAFSRSLSIYFFISYSIAFPVLSWIEFYN